MKNFSPDYGKAAKKDRSRRRWQKERKKLAGKKSERARSEKKWEQGDE